MTEKSAVEQGDREDVDQEERTKRTENLHIQDKARERDATTAKEEASRTSLLCARVKPARANAEK